MPARPSPGAASMPVYLSRTGSNSVPMALKSAGTDCFLCACPQIRLYPFYGAYPPSYSKCSCDICPPTISKPQGVGMSNKLPVSCPTFLPQWDLRFWCAVTMVDKQPAGAASWPSCSHSLSCLHRWRRTCSWCCAGWMAFQTGWPCVAVGCWITPDQTFRKLACLTAPSRT